MKDLKAFLAVGVAMVTLSSCSSDRPQYPGYSGNGNPYAPVRVQPSKDGQGHRAYEGENGRVGPSSAEGTSAYYPQNASGQGASTINNINIINGAPDLPRGWGEPNVPVIRRVVVPRRIYFGRGGYGHNPGHLGPCNDPFCY